MRFADRHAFSECVEAFPDDQLVDLYRLTASVDQAVEGRCAEMEYQFAFLRSLTEEDWKAKAVLTP